MRVKNVISLDWAIYEMSSSVGEVVAVTAGKIEMRFVAGVVKLNAGVRHHRPPELHDPGASPPKRCGTGNRNGLDR
jgi:hypothetical protein